MNYRERAEQHSDPRYARILDKLKPKRAEVAPVIQEPTSLAVPVLPEAPDEEVRQLRADYQELLGKRPYHGWDAYELRARINSALTAPPDAE